MTSGIAIRNIPICAGLFIVGDTCQEIPEVRNRRVRVFEHKKTLSYGIAIRDFQTRFELFILEDVCQYI
jgi:hypothetical protein